MAINRVLGDGLTNSSKVVKKWNYEYQYLIYATQGYQKPLNQKSTLLSLVKILEDWLVKRV